MEIFTSPETMAVVNRGGSLEVTSIVPLSPSWTFNTLASDYVLYYDIQELCHHPTSFRINI